MGGSVPEGWRCVSVGNLAHQRTEKVLPTRHDATPYVALEHIPSGGGRLLSTDVASSASSHKTRFRSGDILFGKLRPNLRKVVRVQLDGVCSTDILAIAASADTHSSFLYHLLASDAVYRHVMGDITGTKMPRTSWERLADFSVMCPPLPEQRAIAAVLDAVDETIEQTVAVMAATEDLRKALLHDLLTLGVPGWHTEWKHVPGLGTIPACWDVVTLGECLEGTPTNGLYKPQSDYGSGTYLIRIDDFDSGRMRRMNGFDRVRASDEEVERYGLRAGDIVINRVNSVELVGKAVLFPDISELAMFESNMMRLRTGLTLSPDYAVFCLTSPRARDYFTSRAKKAVQQASVNQQDVAAFPLPLPPFAEQQRIATVHDGIRSTHGCDESTLAILRSAKTALTEALLSGRVRVKPIAEVIS